MTRTTWTSFPMYEGNGFGRRVIAEAESALLPQGRDGDRVRVLGHRGAPTEGRQENSVAAVTQALSQGADGVEIDVWLSEDGTLLCAHDLAGADRTSLATLPELLAAAQRPSGAAVVVEAKPVADLDLAARTARALADVLGAAAGNADITVSSFDPALLSMIRSACADLPVRTALLGEKADPAAAVVRRAHRDGHDEVHLSLVSLRRSSQAVRTARELGLSVSLWTVNHAADLRWAAELGADAVITDDVAAARRVLGRTPAGELAATAA